MAAPNFAQRMAADRAAKNKTRVHLVGSTSPTANFEKADMTRDKRKGIKEASARDTKIDAKGASKGAPGAAANPSWMKYMPHAAKGGNWIAAATANKGGLHRSLGVPAGKTIPPARIAAAAQKGGKVGRQARLAQTLRGLR